MADRRLLFIRSLDEGHSMSQVCKAYGISRPTGYEILNRFKLEGVNGLYLRSRAPHCSPQAVPQEVIHKILALKSVHVSWGPKKLKASLENSHPEMIWPAASTIGDILERAGLVKKRKLRSRCPSATIDASTPELNDVWCVDYKGQFRLGNQQLCYPLTLSDLRSRFLLRCQGLADTTGRRAWPYFVGAFQEFGLPRAIRSDNGAPFATASTTGLTYLSLQFIRLGIRVERITPGRPQENGTHERMHRTLKAEAIDPVCYTLQAQQDRFSAWQNIYNNERPHEALGQKPPASLYHASPRSFPAVVPEFEYPCGMRVQRVRTDGRIRWRGEFVFVCELLNGQPIGLDQFTEHYHVLYVGHQALAILDDRNKCFLSAKEAAPFLEELARNADPLDQGAKAP